MSKYPILDYMISRKIIDANTTSKGLEISESSLSVIEAGLEEIIFDKDRIKVNKENRTNDSQSIAIKLGNHRIFYKYDWNIFGDGNWREYHNDILENVKTVSALNKSKEHIGFGYSQLPPEKHIEVDLKYVFRKKLPPYIKHDLFEANNYIANTWLILESINFFHSIEEARPSLDDIAYLCLTSYRTELLGRDQRIKKLLNRRTLRHMREGEMRKDISRFKNVGLIDVRKEGHKELYGITSLKFKDGKNTYALMEPERIREEYRKINIRI